MEDYNKIIEALNIKLTGTKRLGLMDPVKVKSFYDVSNSIVLVEKGELFFGEHNQVVKTGDLLFVPSGCTTTVSYGLDPKNQDSEELPIKDAEEHFTREVEEGQETFSFIRFTINAFNAVNFFQSLDIPAFPIENAPRVVQLVKDIHSEAKRDTLGLERSLGLLTELLGIEVFRYLVENHLFVDKLATNLTYFKDPRLLNIFTYIKENLNGDLSNKALSEVANVSEDYVGQFFKTQTNITPQDYIEYQRMEKAVLLLRTTRQSIREVGMEVGYKDTAYFCRRFKMMFGISAGKMRRRESTMNF